MITRKPTATALGLIALLVAASPALQAGDVHYSWKNERGTVVYSDRPPPKGVDYEVISGGSGLKRVVDGDQGAVPLDLSPQPGNEFEVTDAGAADRFEKNKVLCEKAKMNLVALEGADAINVRDEQGEVTELGPEERAVALQTTRAQISVYCP
ncbi:DUF4124 domain-containing protein [Haliea sp. E17]|uniref:DUF4124 domain-containing protein n=1 Tax=Haliea sp. E17 TaxID=3401576 RepID=UPI003AAC32AB